MDRTYNNEAIIACTIEAILKSKDMDVARLALIVVLITDDAIRNRIPKYQDIENMTEKESSFYGAINRKFKEIIPIFINAVVILRQANIIKYVVNNICLTPKGLIISNELSQIKSNRFINILNTVKPAMKILDNTSTINLYKKLKIEL